MIWIPENYQPALRAGGQLGHYAGMEAMNFIALQKHDQT